MELPQNGHISIQRNDPLWDLRSHNDFRVLLTCIRCASHKDFTNFRGIPLKRGQLWVESERKLAFFTRVKRSSLQRVLKRLNGSHICVQECVQSGFIITISNYDTYQGLIQPTASTGASKSGTNGPELAPNGPLLAPNGPPNIEQQEERIKNKSNLDNLIKDTAKNFKNVIDDKEIPALRFLYAWEKREGLKLHLMNRNFTESEIGKIFERVYPQQYTGKAV